MTDSVDTDALRDPAQKTAEEIADVAAHRGGRIRMTIPANVDTDTDLLVDRLEEMALAAADEIDALRARAERAEAAISAAPHADDCIGWFQTLTIGFHDGKCDCWKTDYARDSQPASSERQVQYDDGEWSRTIDVQPAPSPVRIEDMNE